MFQANEKLTKKIVLSDRSNRQQMIHVGFKLQSVLSNGTFFSKLRQKLCPNLLIKKKIVQLINGKPDKNRYNKPQENNNKKHASSKPTSIHNLQPSKTTQRHHGAKKIHITVKQPPKLSFVHHSSFFCPDNYLLESSPPS
jgi:hypothetical protein